jgi:hypothetical protein
MTAKGFEYYGQTVATMVTPTAPTPQAAAAPQATTTRRGSDKLMQGSAYLLVFAGALLLLALIVTVSPLRTIDVDLTVPFCAVVGAAAVAIAWGTVRA